MLKVLKDKLSGNRFRLIGVLIVALLVILAIFINNNLAVVKSSSDIEEALHDSLGVDYYSVYDFSYLDLFGSRVIMTKTDVNLEVPKFDSNQRDSFSKAIDYVNDFSYNPAQSDPNFVTVMGGNCQALSIIFKEVCDKNSIECTLDGTKTHVYNLVTVDSETYKVDLTNKTVEKLE